MRRSAGAGIDRIESQHSLSLIQWGFTSMKILSMFGTRVEGRGFRPRASMVSRLFYYSRFSGKVSGLGQKSWALPGL